MGTVELVWLEADGEYAMLNGPLVASIYESVLSAGYVWRVSFDQGWMHEPSRRFETYDGGKTYTLEDAFARCERTMTEAENFYELN